MGFFSLVFFLFFLHPVLGPPLPAPTYIEHAVASFLYNCCVGCTDLDFPCDEGCGSQPSVSSALVPG